MMMEKNTLQNLKQQLVKEGMQEGVNLSHVPIGFYEEVNDYISSTNNDEARVLFAKFKRIRITKMPRLAWAFTDSISIKDCLTPEELEIYRNIINEFERFWAL